MHCAVGLITLVLRLGAGVETPPGTWDPGDPKHLDGDPRARPRVLEGGTAETQVAVGVGREGGD